MWVAPALICGMYIGAELMIPEKKKLILGIYLVFGIIFELFLWFDTNNSFIFILPANLGENIIDVRLNRRHPTFFLIAFFLLSVLIFNGFGFLFKSIKSTGILRKKFLYLSLGWIVFVSAGALDSLTAPGIGLFLVRIVMMSSSIFWYLGLKEQHVKTKRQPSEEKVILEESETSLIETLSLSKPSEITKEEVSLYREQNICLVCKSKVLGFSFICECNTLYCQKCAQALVQLDNACWVCNAPIDESKPSKPFKKEEEAIEVEISEKITKTPKIDKDSH